MLIGFYSTKAEPRTLTLEEAIELALDNSTETKVALLEIKKAQARVNEAFGYAYPTVDFSTNFTHFIEKPQIPFIDFQSLLAYSTLMTMSQMGVLVPDPVTGDPVPFSYNQPYKEKYALMSMSLANSFETKLQATQILFNSAVFKGIGASKIYLDLSQESLRSTTTKTVTNVKKAFNGVLLTREMLEIMKASLTNAENNLKNVKAYYEQGLVSEFDMLTVQVQIENLRPTITQLENGLKQAKDGLKMVLGFNQDEEIDVEGEIVYNKADYNDVNALVKKAMSDNYDIKTFDIKKKIDNEFIELDRAGYWPTIAAFGSYSISGQSDNFDFMNYNTGVVGISFSMNLFNGLRTDEKVQQSTIAVMQTEEQLAQMKEFVKTQVKAKYLELERVNKLLESQERNVELAEKAYKIANVKYREGTGTQLDIQNAEMALRVAKTNKLQSIFEYITAKADLEQLTGETDKKYFQQVFKKTNKQ
jgi:outer membrane protein TolC